SRHTSPPSRSPPPASAGGRGGLPGRGAERPIHSTAPSPSTPHHPQQAAPRPGGLDSARGSPSSAPAHPAPDPPPRRGFGDPGRLPLLARGGAGPRRQGLPTGPDPAGGPPRGAGDHRPRIRQRSPPAGGAAARHHP